MRFYTLLANLLLLSSLLSSLGCTTVAPWERGTMAKKEMAPDPNPKLNHLRDHIFTSREASQSSGSGSGGGCGCN